MSREHIYIATAWCNGQRVEQIAHTTEDGAHEDIEVMASGYDGEIETEVRKLRLYRGPEGKEPITFFDENENAAEINRGP